LVTRHTGERCLHSRAWTVELATGSEDTISAPFGRKTLTPHPLAKLVKVSNTFLRNPTFDAEAWVRDQLAYKFTIPEEAAFISGTGAEQPLGLLNTTSLPTYTTAAALTVTADDLINWAYRLPAGYVNARTRILCNRALIRKVRLLKDANGQYLWQPGLSAGSPGTLLDTPYVFSDQMDDGLDSSTDAWEASAKIAVIGDFDYYWIEDSLSLSIQRVVELYATTNQTGYIGRKETDGMCVMPEAFYGLVVHA
jgi:HK97 family phage major capsid protein